MVRKQDNSIINFLNLLEHCKSCVEKPAKKKPATKKQQKRSQSI